MKESPKSSMGEHHEAKFSAATTTTTTTLTTRRRKEIRMGRSINWRTVQHNFRRAPQHPYMLLKFK